MLIIRDQYCKGTCRIYPLRLQNSVIYYFSFCTDPPEFTSVSDDQVVVEGGPSITLQCFAIGEPPPYLTWTRLLDNGSESSVLSIWTPLVLDNNRSSTGTYRCTAFNGIGTAPNRTIVVNVNCKLFSYNMFYLPYKTSVSCCI